MDEIDQLLSKLEGDLFTHLESSADPKTRNLVGAINHLRGAKELLRRQFTPAFVVDPNPKGVIAATNGNGHPVGWTQGDAAAEILRKAGEPLHISKIMAEFPKYGITDAKKANLGSILIKDRRNRFINKGQATFVLNPHPREDAEQKQRTQGGFPAGFVLVESVKKLLPELKGREFSQPDIYKILTERHPDAADRIKKASIAQVLGTLKDRGLIGITHLGQGSEPRRYRVTE